MGRDSPRLDPADTRRAPRAGGRAVGAEPGRPSRLRLFLRRRRGLLRPLATWVVGIAALAAVGLAIRAADPVTRLAHLTENAAGIGAGAGLAIREIVVEGRRNTPLEQIRDALGVSRGDPTLAFDPVAARERLRAIAWVDGVSVERQLPGTILVRMTERMPFAIWQNGGRFAVIDRAGRTVATEQLDAFGPLPLLVGPGAERGAAALYDLLTGQPEVLARTQALVRVGERRWNLRLHSGTDVLLPEGQEAAAIARLGELQARQGLLDRPLQTVDLRLPDRLVVRQMPAPEPALRPTVSRGGSIRG